ncbi:GIY-YIG nuclease family protein [Murimonas intestini]|uniref:GIY-YIG nuclease family protein n=1 Tax=Murimonas intestini TaxID=1337051 RepID=UPI0011DDF3C5
MCALYIDGCCGGKVEKTNYTYILRCSDGTLYTGWTNDLDKRVADHNAGKGAKYTKGRTPVSVAYYEVFKTKQEAMHREYEIKHMSRAKKQQLLKEGQAQAD